jgi:hypothetical protein
LRTNKISDADFIKKFNEGLNYRELSEYFCVSPATVQKYIKILHLQKRETVDKVDKMRLAELWNQGVSCSTIGLKERALKRATTKVSDTVVSKPTPTFIPPKLEKPEPADDKPKKPIFIAPTLQEIRRMEQQEAIKRAKREYKIFKRD